MSNTCLSVFTGANGVGCKTGETVAVVVFAESAHVHSLIPSFLNIQVFQAYNLNQKPGLTVGCLVKLRFCKRWIVAYLFLSSQPTYCSAEVF